MTHRKHVLPNSRAAALSVIVWAALMLLAGCSGGSAGGGNPASGLTITTPSLPNGQVGVAYNATLVVTGGTPPYTWSLISGTPPAGLTWTAATASISGMPTATAGSVSLTFKVTDSGNPVLTQTTTLALTVVPVSLGITTASLANGQVGVAYSATLAATGGIAPYNWTIANGSLPQGLQLAPTGVISGTPTQSASNDSVTFKVIDSSNPTQAQTSTLTITVIPAPLAITTASLPNGQVSVVYNVALAATGGVAPYNWTITSGSLPQGLQLASTGMISGTPTQPATNDSVTFQVKDSSNPASTQSATLKLTIAPPPPTITTASLPNGQVGVAYSATLAATGGVAPYSWTVTNGLLPQNLSLASTGLISGTPTLPATNDSVTFQVKDSSSPAQTQTATLTITIAPATLAITTSALPNGQVGVAYSTTLALTGGTTPFTWTLTSGILPNNLMLNPDGTITGTPAATVTSTPLTFQVKDSGTPQQTQSVNLTLTIDPGPAITVSTSPKRAGLSVTQTLSLTATTNDASGVKWSISPAGGSFSAGTSQTGVAVTLTAPSTAGDYTVTATSVTNSTLSSSITIGVTNLAGVYTYHNDIARDGANLQEYALATSLVNSSTFGKLFSCTVDGAIYAQPLWVANVTISGTKHNVVIVATEHDSLYAFDADANPCVQLWDVSLIDSNHGGTAGETSVPSSMVGQGSGDLAPEIGVTGTPVIDPATNTLFVVSKSVVGSTFHQRLHAIDFTTGSEKSGSPVNIAATYSGTGDGGTIDTFNLQQEAQRPGLAFVKGVVYIAWASHADNPPYYGWIIGYAYNGSAFTQASVLNVTPNVGFGGIWMSGGAPAIDSSNNLYVITGNGGFDATSVTAPNNDYGDSFLKLSTGLAVSQYFTPSDQSNDQQHDADFGSGGAAILADMPAGSPVTHLVMGGGKDGNLYVLNRDSMGGLGDGQAWQVVAVSHSMFSTGAFWNNSFYLGTVSGSIDQYSLNPSTVKFTFVNSAPGGFEFPGATPSVSSQGTSNGIVWAIDAHTYCTEQSQGCGPAVLHAFNATSITTELWNSSMVSTDAAGNAVKFNVPTVANGKVYVGTRGNNTGGAFESTTVSGELDVYGLKPN